MANLKVSWVLPTTRTSGRPLPPDAIASVKLEISADGGLNYATFDSYPPTILDTTVTDLEPGDWFFRATVFDTAGRSSQPFIANTFIEDTSPPNALKSLTLSLA